MGTDEVNDNKNKINDNKDNLDNLILGDNVAIRCCDSCNSCRKFQ